MAPQYNMTKITPAIINSQQTRHMFTTELQSALENEQFILYYQPIINADNDQITNIEVLLRWQHPDHGLLSPDLFLSLCENTGLIVPLGSWVLRSACEQLKKWHAMGYPKLNLSVNISPRQLNYPGFLELITEVLHINDISSSCLQLEITENIILQNVESNIKLLKILSDLGIQLSLDDFGTGYSSLNYLKQFPFNILKIDKTFVADMTTNITSFAIVESIIALGKSLGLTLIAEGVESENQLYMLKKMRCDKVQGYLYSKPISVEEFTQLLLTSDRISKHQISVNDADPYQYKILESEHYTQVVNVITQSFCTDEPMTKYLGITPREFFPFAELVVKKAIKDRLSTIVLDGDKVSACSIIEDTADPLDIIIDIDPRFKIIFSFLEYLGGDFFSEKNIEKGHLAHLFFTAVDKNYHGKGLSRKVNFESIQLAKEKGFDFMCCEFTHHYNEKGTIKNLKNSKLLIKSCSYKDFIFEGKKPFENLDGHASAYIWELREDAKLRYNFKPPE